MMSQLLQMFAMVVLFGLIHGLVLLPICLSLVGPLPSADDEKGGEHVELARDGFIQQSSLSDLKSDLWDGFHQI